MKTENLIAVIVGIVTVSLGLYTFQRMRAAVPGTAASSPARPISAPNYSGYGVGSTFSAETLAYQRDMADVWL